MSEDFLKEIADELNAQTVKPAEAPAEIATEVASEPTNTTEQTQASTETATETVEKEWWDKDDSVSTETTTKTETTDTSVEMDEDVKLILEYKKSGKTLADFVKEYQVNDFKEWTDEKFVKEGLKEFMNLTPEEIEQASYEFDNASVFQKKQWAESFKEKFENKNKEMLKQLTSSQSENQAKSEALVEKYRTELDGYSQTIVNKEMYGLKITDEMSKNLKDYIDKEFTLQKADGSFDVEKMYSIAMWLKHGADLVKANVTKARNEGKEQVIREVINPSRNFTNVGKNVGSGLEAAQEAFNTLFPG
jgi:hypothetical protein